MFIQSRHQIKSLSTTYSWRTQINRHQSQKRWWPFLICLSVSLINRHHDWSIRVLAQNSPISLINAWRKIQMNELISRLYWWVQNLNVRSDWVRFRNWELSGLFWTLSEMRVSNHKQAKRGPGWSSRTNLPVLIQNTQIQNFMQFFFECPKQSRCWPLILVKLSNW